VTIQNVSHCHSVGDLVGVWLEQLRVESAHTPGRPGALDGDMTIEAIPTWYADTTFRSQLEGSWAATLDSLAIRWQYEPETITLPSGATYIPDFWLPDVGTWLEVKGTGVPRIEKAVELGESRACRCGDACTCDWPGGELVLIGHPPTPGRRHRRRPAWSTAYGRPAWLAKCYRCHVTGWFNAGTCRACRLRHGGGHAYRSGEEGIEFVSHGCRPAPTANVPAPDRRCNRQETR
jgi:hypothetical protein